MANMEINIPHDFINQLSRLERNMPEIMEKVLNAGMDVLEPEIEKELKAVIGKGTLYDSRSTGVLVESVKRMKVAKHAGVWSQRIRFVGTRKHEITRGKNKGKIASVRNNEIAAVLEYGKENQEATYFIRNTISGTREEVIEAMQEEFNKHL